MPQMACGFVCFWVIPILPRRAGRGKLTSPFLAGLARDKIPT